MLPQISSWRGLFFTSSVKLDLALSPSNLSFILVCVESHIRDHLIWTFRASFREYFAFVNCTIFDVTPWLASGFCVNKLFQTLRFASRVQEWFNSLAIYTCVTKECVTIVLCVLLWVSAWCEAYMLGFNLIHWCKFYFPFFLGGGGGRRGAGQYGYVWK